MPFVLASRRQLFPPFVIPSAFVLFVTFGLGQNFTLAALAIVVLIIGSALVWRPGEPPAFLYVFIMQWLSSAVCIFSANAQNISVDTYGVLVGVPGDTGTATALSLLATLVLAAGFSIGSGKLATNSVLKAQAEIPHSSANLWLYLYLLFVVFGFLATFVSRQAPGLTQVLLPIVEFRWAAYMLFTQIAFRNRGNALFLWLIIFGLEFGVALGGYFSSFQKVFVYTFVSLYSSGKRLPVTRIWILTFTALITIAVGLIWTAVKPEYRHFVSEGKKAQVVRVTYSEAIVKLAELVGRLDHTDLAHASWILAARVSNTEYFGATLNHVPNFVPHENGMLLLDAVTRPFMPRVFFPEKDIIDESAKTNRYTGLKVAGMDQGVAIALGFWAECYIDFGFPLMMVPVFLWGFLNGVAYKRIAVSFSGGGALALNIASVFVIGMNYSGIEKMFGQFVASIIAIYITHVLIKAAKAHALHRHRSNTRFYTDN